MSAPAEQRTFFLVRQSPASRWAVIEVDKVDAYRREKFEVVTVREVSEQPSHDDATGGVCPTCTRNYRLDGCADSWHGENWGQPTHTAGEDAEAYVFVTCWQCKGGGEVGWLRNPPDPQTERTAMCGTCHGHGEVAVDRHEWLPVDASAGLAVETVFDLRYTAECRDCDHLDTYGREFERDLAYAHAREHPGHRVAFKVSRQFDVKAAAFVERFPTAPKVPQKVNPEPTLYEDGRYDDLLTAVGYYEEKQQLKSLSDDVFEPLMEKGGPYDS